MEDFKINPASANLPYGEAPLQVTDRKRDRRPRERTPEQGEDDVVLSGDTEGAEVVKDYYVPSRPDEPQE